MKESVKNICGNVKGFCKKHKKKIIVTISTCVVLVIVVAGVAYGVSYSNANANIKYSQEEMEKVALAKVPGEVVDTEKELNFREAIYEYEFKIKDKNNTLQEVTVNSKYGTLGRENDKKSHYGDKEKRGGEKNKNKNNQYSVENGED